MRTLIKHYSYIDKCSTWRDLYGLIHREDGPAIIYDNGLEEYYFNGEYFPDVHSVEELIIKLIIE